MWINLYFFTVGILNMNMIYMLVKIISEKDVGGRVGEIGGGRG